MGSKYLDHDHSKPRPFRSAAPSTAFAAVVGTVDTTSEKPITGRSGDHLQFYVDINASLRYQVDVNTQSSDGTAVNVFVADETLTPTDVQPPFGPPAFGVFPAPDTKLSYSGMKLQATSFAPISDTRLDAQLEAALGQSSFVSIYGFTFDDGGADGKGIHETHLNPGKQNQDGAVAIYIDQPNQPPLRRWFFFMFQGEAIA